MQKIAKILGISLGFLFSDEPVSERFGENSKNMAAAVKRIARECGIKDEEVTPEEIAFFKWIDSLEQPERTAVIKIAKTIGNTDRFLKPDMS